MFDINAIRNESIYPYLLQHQLELWRFILNLHVDVKERFCNPFRDDSNPGVWLDWYGDYLLLNDFAHRHFMGMTVFEATKFKYNCTFKEALDILEHKSNIPAIYSKKANKSQSIITDVYKPIIKFVPKKTKNNKIWFDQSDIDVWKPLDISPKLLVRDSVYPVHLYKFNTKKHPNKLFLQLPDDPTFALFFKASNHKKIYRPEILDERLKWLTDCDVNDIGFLWNIVSKGASRKFLIVTKSYKDARILLNLGYDVIWVQSETTYLPDNVVKYLAKKYDQIFLLFDNDEAGIKNSLKMTEYYNDLINKPIFAATWYNTGNDTAEIYEHQGKDTLLTELKNMF